MARDQDELAGILRAIADFIENTSSADLKALAGGDARISLIHNPGERKNIADPKHLRHPDTSEHIRELMDRLRSLESREEGAALLDEKQLSRRSLELLARNLDLPVRKTDNVERMRDMIVDATIGARLNSRAIRGK